MNLLQDCINYVRRIIKSPSNQVVSDNLIIDYINRFWLMDVDARVELYDLKTKYSFQTSPGVDQYNVPLYGFNGYLNTAQPGSQSISYYPVYQGMIGPCYVNGVEVPFYTERQTFFRTWPNLVQQLNNTATGDGVTTTFSLYLPFFPALRGHVDITGVINQSATFPIGPPVNDPITGTSYNSLVPKTSVYPAVTITSVDIYGNPLIVSDTGQFLSSNVNVGFLSGNATGSSSTVNIVNYTTGEVSVTFDSAPADGSAINIQCYFLNQGMPSRVLLFNNIIILRTVPDISYLVELDAVLTPAAFLSQTQSINFAYMTEYIARGAAQKMLSDTGDTDQFMFYQPLFIEQEKLVLKRSERTKTSTRTATIYSSQSTGYNNGQVL